MTTTLEESPEARKARVLARREEALLDMRVGSLARAGLPIARAYQPPIPQKMKPRQFRHLSQPEMDAWTQHLLARS